MPVMEGNGEAEENVLGNKVLPLRPPEVSLARPSDFETYEWWKFARLLLLLLLDSQFV